MSDEELGVRRLSKRLCTRPSQHRFVSHSLTAVARGRSLASSSNDVNMADAEVSGPGYGHNHHPNHIDLPDPYSSHVREDLPSPLQMSAKDINGLESIQAARLSKHGGLSPTSESSSLLDLRIQSFRSTADLALVAMQYLPTPLIVLNNLKTIVLANDAMGRLMALDEADDEVDATSDDGLSSTDKLKGKSLSQIGIDVMQDGR